MTWTLSGTTVTIEKSFNVASGVRNGTGNYTITFTSAMTDAFYVPTCLYSGAGNAISYLNSAPLVGSFDLKFNLVGTGLQDQAQVSVAVFGN